AGVGSADDQRRARPLPRDADAVPLLAAGTMRLGFFLDAADLALQLGLQLLGGLMFRHFPKHDLQATQFLLGRRRAAILLLGLEILRREIGCHAPILAVGGSRWAVGSYLNEL